MLMFKLFTLITATQCANILVFAPMPFKSHFRGFQPLFKELASRGHNLTVVSTFPLKTPLPNYTDITISINKNISKGNQLFQIIDNKKRIKIFII